jgi:hypothetical protein
MFDQAFGKGEITPDRLAAETAAIGELAGPLRLVRLAAHLETHALLNPDQIALYQHLRGYGDPAGAPSSRLAIKARGGLGRRGNSPQAVWASRSERIPRVQAR